MIFPEVNTAVVFFVSGTRQRNCASRYIPSRKIESREKRVEDLEQQLTRRSQIEEKVDTLAKQQKDSNARLFIQWYDYFCSEE